MTMKSLVTATLVATLMSTTAIAKEAVIGLSPNQTQQALQSQVEGVLELLMATLEPGEKAVFVDAANPRRIATFTRPQGRAGENPRAVLQANGEAISALRTFMVSASANPSNPGLIDMPALLRFVAETLPAKDGKNLIIIGSPIFEHPLSPGLSMQGGRVFGDGHITVPMTTSPIGAGLHLDQLDGYQTFVGLTWDGWPVSTRHEAYVLRGWSLLSEAFGAPMMYIGDDLATLFDAVQNPPASRAHPVPLVPTDKLEMIEFGPGIGGGLPSFFTDPLEVAPAPEPLWRDANDVKIALTWEETDVDLDLYVRPKPDAAVVFYGNARTPEAQLFKDFLASPTTGFETIQFLGSGIDLSQVRIAVNFYGGATPRGVNGELRVVIGDQIWASTFTMDAQRGNKGSGAEAVLTQDTTREGWIIFDPLEIVSGG